MQHNMQAIQMEDPLTAKPNTSAYRAAAVQIITLGGDRNKAHRLMDVARAREGQKCQLSTSAGTCELLAMMLARRGDAGLQLDREKEKEHEKLALLASLANEDVSTMLDKVLNRKKKT